MGEGAHPDDDAVGDRAGGDNDDRDDHLWGSAVVNRNVYSRDTGRGNSREGGGVSVQ